MNRSVHTKTPVLHVSDPRGLNVRTVNYWRDSADQVAQRRCDRHRYDVVGRLVAEWDPRLAADDSAPANLAVTASLSHKALATQSVDAGWRVNLFAEAGQLIQVWDARGNALLTEYDQLLRPSAVFEQGCTQRYEYAGAEEHFAGHNQCGQLIRHDDAAGTRLFEEYGVAGEVLALRQHFLQTLDEPDWPLPIDQRNELLEPGTGAFTAFRFNALGDLTVQVDAQGNCQQFNQTVDGQLREVGLLLDGKVEAQRLVRDIRYGAQGQIEQQTAGNQVVSLLDYSPRDGRLTRLRARQPNGELLQDLHYTYDPVGNILGIEDKALLVRFFANQRIDPINHYIYDSLYQLVEATGWEAGSDNRGPAHLEDPRAVGNYRQAYRYDAGGNLLELTHQGPQQHGRVLTAAKHSNRCLPSKDGRPPTDAEIAAGFDRNGNLLELDNVRTLRWDARNQLHQVTPVERDSQPDDTERYIYAADGMRQRKVRRLKTNARTVISETRYLPGLEMRNVDGTRLNVITVQAGRMTVQVLHWQTLPSGRLANDQYRYCLGDHLGSCSLELDSDARVVSRETYHPYGTTAFSERGGSSEQSFRTLRYSGKERDATGLYYYGFRYYAFWLLRWLNPDPAGTVDGLNLFAYVNGNPVTFMDVGGAGKIDINALTSDQEQASGFNEPQESPVWALIQHQLLNRKAGVKNEVVSDSLFTSLEQARTVNFITKGLLVNGSPNQVLDLWRAPMKPSQMWDRLVTERKRAEVGVTGMIDSCVGNCGEHAKLNFHLLASANTQAPVFWVQAAEGEDHQFSVIGDHRLLPANKLVIADAWPTFPMAHLGDVGVFDVGHVLIGASAEADPSYQVDDAALISNSQIGFPVRDPSGSKAKKHYKKIEKVPGTYNQLFSVEDESLIFSYSTSGGRSLNNGAPKSFIKGRVAHYVSYDKARQKYG